MTGLLISRLVVVGLTINEQTLFSSSFEGAMRQALPHMIRRVFERRDWMQIIIGITNGMQTGALTARTAVWGPSLDSSAC